MVDGDTITWNGLNLKADQTFVTVIVRVTLSDVTGDGYEWLTSINDEPITDDPNTDADETANIIVLGTVKEDIDFEIVDEFDISVSLPLYPAVSEEQIRFRFEAEDTTIQEGGSVWFNIPSSWTKPDFDAKDKDKGVKAKTGILVDGALVEETADDGKGWTLKISGHKITVEIGAEGTLNEGDSITIQYGDGDFPGIIQDNKSGDPTKDGDGVSIRGYYRAAKASDGFRQRDAGKIWVDVGNVADGDATPGTATITTSPGTIRAGTTDNLIKVVFTAVGTMDGGAVRLTIPPGWGPMQQDPLERNYIQVVPRSALADEDPLDLTDDGVTITATLKKFAAGNTLTFIYGDGTGAADKKGAEAQDDIDSAFFEIDADADADGVFASVEGEEPSEDLPESNLPGRFTTKRASTVFLKLSSRVQRAVRVKLRLP